MVRILLLLLPVTVAILLFLEGQEYDPALIDFASAGNLSPTNLLPDSLAGYGRTGENREFTAENLYEYVDGHAEYYISAGFIGLVVGEYVRLGEESASPEIVIEIFELGSDLQAFGILADEAGEVPLGSDIGSFSLENSRGIRFVAGNYYVRVNTYRDDAPHLEFARRIAGDIGGRSDVRTFFANLPDLGLPVATRFIREAYRGIDFLNDVIEREYSRNGDTIYLFLVRGDEGEIRELTDSFFEFFRGSGIEYRLLEDYGRSYFRVQDPYEGNWYLVPGENAIYGMYGARDDGAVLQLLQNLDMETP